MLKPLLLMLALSLPVNAMAATAEAYLGIFGGAIEVEGMETERARPLILNLGYRINAYWAAQLEYSEAHFNGAFRHQGQTLPGEVSYATKAGYLMMVLPTGLLLDLNLKAGYMALDYRFSDTGVPEPPGSYADSGFAYGGGLTLKAFRDMVLTLDVTQLRDGAEQYSAGVEFAL